MRTLIDDYPNAPGEHCGSVAMRSLFRHYCGLDLPEGVVFGLGSGLDCMILVNPALDPAYAVFGRSGTMEVDAASALGVDYREQIETDDDVAWKVARDEVLAGRPTMLSGDILYLDYREYKVHFPAHRFVLLGFDDQSEKAYIADRIHVAPELCSYAALRTSRNPPEGLSTHNLWGRFHSTEPSRSLEEACRVAVDRCAGRMLGKGGSESEAALYFEGADVTRGLAGIRRLAEELPTWADREDARWLASYNGRCIEKFGNGGENFRRLYADFLAWARELDPERVSADASALATRAADAWTALAATLATASDEESDPALFEQAGGQAAQIETIERELFEKLYAGAQG